MVKIESDHVQRRRNPDASPFGRQALDQLETGHRHQRTGVDVRLLDGEKPFGAESFRHADYDRQGKAGGLSLSSVEHGAILVVET